MIQPIDIGLGQDLVQVFVARAPRRVAAAAQSARELAGNEYGFELRSRLLKSVTSSCGNLLCSRTRLRRISTINGTCSMLTGHCSIHARQVVQSHSSSSDTTSPISL